MALINCPECGKEISDKAASCPHCGNPLSQTQTTQTNAKPAETPEKKKTSGVFKLFIFFIGLLILIAIFGPCNEDKNKEEPKTPVALTPEEKKFGPRPVTSPWDGSVRIVKDYIMAVAKDPDSVKFEGWSDINFHPKDGWLVQVDWRAKNSFGGYVRNVNWFVIRHGQVVKMEPGNAYK